MAITHINGKPWRQQSGFNAEINDATGFVWTAETSLPATLHIAQSVVTKNRVYLIGGSANGLIDGTIYTAPIDVNGTIGTWGVHSPSLPASAGAAWSQVILTKGHVYLIGGYDGYNHTKASFTAPVDTDGIIGAWAQVSDGLPTTLSHHQAVVTKNRVYLLGGTTSSGVETSAVCYSPIGEDGLLGAWVVDTSLPGVLADSQVVITKDRIYLFGGITETYPDDIVFTAPIDVDGVIGTWATDTNLFDTVKVSQAVVTDGTVYLIGGSDGSYGQIVESTPVDASGLIGTWAAGTILPNDTYAHQVIVTSSKLYMLGGYDSGGALAEVYSTPFAGGFNDYTKLAYYDDATIVDMVSPLAEINGTALVYRSVGYGRCVTLPAVVTSELFNYILCYGAISSEPAGVDSVGLNKILGYGHVAPKHASIYGDYVSVGRVEVPLSTIESQALNNIIGSGVVNTYSANLAGTGVLSLIGVSNLHPKLAAISSQGTIYPFGSGKINTKTPEVSAYGHVRISVECYINTPLPRLTINGKQPDSFTVISHSRAGQCH